MRRAVIIAIGLMLAVTACAAGDVGGEATDPPEPAGTGQSEPAGGGGDADPTEAPTGDSDDPLSGFRDDEASAVVIIGDERYEFDGLRCVTMGGALGAASMGGDPSVNISLPPTDWESSGDDWDPPSVRVDGDDPYFHFEAGGDVVLMSPDLAETYMVTSFTSDGYRASGTAAFVDMTQLADPPPPINGTFEVSCPRP
jgi:hypothetical protein